MGVPELQRSRNLQKSVSEREVERVQHQERESKKGVGVERDWRQSGSGDEGGSDRGGGCGEGGKEKQQRRESDKQRGRSRENEQGIH